MGRQPPPIIENVEGETGRLIEADAVLSVGMMRLRLEAPDIAPLIVERH